MVGIRPGMERFVVWPSSGAKFKNGQEWLDGPYDYSAYVFSVADVTGDGKADVVGIRPGMERFVVWPSSGAKFKNGQEWLDGPYDYSAYVFSVADVTGDGKADVAGIHKNDDRFVMWESNGVQFIGGKEALKEPLNYSVYQFHLADVNGNNAMDVIGIHSGYERFVVWMDKRKHMQYLPLVCNDRR